MSTAEERLGKCDHAVTVWEGREISKNQKYTVEACYAYDLAREAIALLRESPKYKRHDSRCAGLRGFRRDCDCGKFDYEERRDKFLDGEP